MNRIFGLKEWVSLAVIPFMYGIIYIVFAITNSSITTSVIDAIVRISLFILLIVLFRKTLSYQWQEFKKLKKSKWLVVVLGAVFLQIIISITSTYVPKVKTDQVEMLKGLDFDYLTISWPFFFLLLFTSLSPIVTSLIEDITFKHTLLKKLLTESKSINIVIILANSILFGAIHYANFGNSIINTIPYMVAGLFLNLIYLKTKNLWHVLLIHFINNFALSMLSILFIGILRIFI